MDKTVWVIKAEDGKIHAIFYSDYHAKNTTRNKWKHQGTCIFNITNPAKIQVVCPDGSIWAIEEHPVFQLPTHL